MTNRCANCPTDPSHWCPGLAGRRLCDLVNPAHPDHQPAYRESIRSSAAKIAASEVDRLVARPGEPPAPAVEPGSPSSDGLIHASTSGQYPGAIRQAGNAMGAIGRVVVAAATGRAIAVSEEEQARRLDICRACPEFDPEPGRCKKCGCVGKWKTAMKTENCPIEKW